PKNPSGCWLNCDLNLFGHCPPDYERFYPYCKQQTCHDPKFKYKCGRACVSKPGHCFNQVLDLIIDWDDSFKCPREPSAHPTTTYSSTTVKTTTTHVVSTTSIIITDPPYTTSETTRTTTTTTVPTTSIIVTDPPYTTSEATTSEASTTSEATSSTTVSSTTTVPSTNPTWTPVGPVTGCVYSVSGWSERLDDPAWSKVSAAFFNSFPIQNIFNEKNYSGVFWDLAREWLASNLNQVNGASISDLSRTSTHKTYLFLRDNYHNGKPSTTWTLDSVYNGYKLGDLQKSLFNYNNGLNRALNKRNVGNNPPACK
ncbi:hypothetical protein HK099_001174, partial [Clydaea vesicula]